MKPVLFVTGHAPAYRSGALAELDAREHIELVLFGGRARHGGPAAVTDAGGPAAAPLSARTVAPRELFALAASGRYRAVVVSTAGRLAPLAAWAGARAGRTPVILWASLWAHPRTPAHALGYPVLRRLYRSADAVVSYGEHVSSYVRARGARNVFIAPQSVDNDFWGEPQVAPPSSPAWPEGEAVRFLFVGRPEREKGLAVLLEAWAESALRPPDASLVLVGRELLAGGAPGGAGMGLAREGVHALGALDPVGLRSAYEAADALVVPSIPTRTFREPWGLVVNEAMNRRLPVIASDAVGAAAGGLVRDGETGLVVRAGDAPALAAAMRRLAGDQQLRARMGAAGARAVSAYTHADWARGFSRALESLGLACTPVAAGSVGEPR